MDSSEVIWRLRNIAAGQIDLLRILTRTYPRLSRKRTTAYGDFRPGFRCTPVPVITDVTAVSGQVEEWRERLLPDADMLLEDRMRFFDMHGQSLGDPIDWHRDHSAGIRGPVRPSLLTDYRKFEEYGDCKLVWEHKINSCSMFNSGLCGIPTEYAVIDAMVEFIFSFNSCISPTFKSASSS